MKIIMENGIRKSYYGKRAFAIVEKDGTQYTVGTTKNYSGNITTYVSKITSEHEGVIITAGAEFSENWGKKRATEKTLLELNQKAIDLFNIK